MTIDMSQFFQVFFDEAEELLAEKEKLLLAIDIENPDIEDLNAIFRAAHSIKGGASTFGLTDMTEVTHILESLLDKIRKGEMPLTAEHVDAFLIAKDILKMQLDGHRHGAAVDQDAVADVRMLLQSLSQDLPIQNESSNNVLSVHELAALAETFAHCYKIELPQLTKDDNNNIVSELGLLGVISKSEVLEGKTILTLRTNSSEEDIVAICSFILNPDDLKISAEDIGNALTSDKKVSSDDDLGYGFLNLLSQCFRR